MSWMQPKCPTSGSVATGRRCKDRVLIYTHRGCCPSLSCHAAPTHEEQKRKVKEDGKDLRTSITEKDLSENKRSYQGKRKIKVSSWTAGRKRKRSKAGK